MLEALLQLDTDLFLWVNDHHNTVLDWVMWTLSQHWCWAIVLIPSIAWLMIYEKKHKKDSTLNTQHSTLIWLVPPAILLCFLLADQGSVHLFKDTVCRLRPCHALDDVRMFRTNCGGQYGFVSSHAANAFAIVTLLWMRYRKMCKTGVILLIIWALLTSYSRAYLGKHYPGDLVCGALFGVVVGMLVWGVVYFFEKKFKKCETK